MDRPTTTHRDARGWRTFPPDVPPGLVRSFLRDLAPPASMDNSSNSKLSTSSSSFNAAFVATYAYTADIRRQFAPILASIGRMEAIARRAKERRPDAKYYFDGELLPGGFKVVKKMRFDSQGNEEWYEQEEYSDLLADDCHVSWGSTRVQSVIVKSTEEAQ